MAFFTVLFTLSACAVQAQDVQQPYWPANCDKFASSLKPTVRIDGPRNLYGEDFYACYSVGTNCTSNDDCSLPTADQCGAAAPGNPGPYLPTQAMCLDGYCRLRSDRENAPCDCLRGCEHETESGKLLSCIAGLCKAAPCAPCGEKPNGRLCCGSGVVGHGGTCYCATGVGEGCVSRRDACVDDDYSCCAKGTDNEGFCCLEGTCNGKCLFKKGFH